MPEAGYSPLGCAVERRSRGALAASNSTQQHDMALSGSEHQRQHCPDREKRTEKVDLDNLMPGMWIAIEETGALPLLTGDHEEVKPSPCRGELHRRSLQRTGVG